MVLHGALAQAASIKCPHCGVTYGDSNGKKGHSKKNFIRCLYTADHDLANALIRIDTVTNERNEANNKVAELQDKVNELEKKLGSKKIEE